MPLPNKEVRTDAQAAVVSEFIDDLSSQSLATRIHKELNTDQVLELFQAGSDGFYNIAQSLIEKNLDNPKILDDIAEFLSHAENNRPPLLHVLSSIKLPEHQKIENALLDLTKDKLEIIGELATQVIAFRYPQYVPRLVSAITYPIAKGLCYSQDPSLLPQVIKVLREKDDKSPPELVLGLLVTPEGLSKVLQEDQEYGLKLAHRFGYIDHHNEGLTTEVVNNLLPYLSAGFHTVDPSLIGQDIASLQALEAQFIRSLIPWSIGITPFIPQGLDFSEPVTQAVFLSAVRASENENISLKRDEKPYAARKRGNFAWTEFSRKEVYHLKRELIYEPLKRAGEWGLSQEQTTQYIIEYANARLERDRDTKDEQLLLLKGRWEHISRFKVEDPRTLETFPLKAYADYPEIVQIVLPDPIRQPPGRIEPLSLGARSARSLLHYMKLDPLTDVLAESEKHFRMIMPTVGIEIQNVFTRERQNESIAWKQALRGFGIPSPRRPEYRAMVEASFAPAYSYHAQVASILGLRSLGFFRERTELALHVSLGAKLDEDVRYLMFATMLAAVPTGSFGVGSTLMSKGFVHQHPGVQDLISDKTIKELFRTELRGGRIDSLDMRLSILPQFIDDIVAYVLLGGASISPVPALQSIWADFSEDVRAETKRLPEVFQELLYTDWFQSTGEPYDKHFTKILPIIQLRIDALTWAVENDKRQVLRQAFGKIRNKHAKRVFDAIPKAKVYEEHPNLFTRSAAGIPVFTPKFRPKLTAHRQEEI